MTEPSRQILELPKKQFRIRTGKVEYVEHKRVTKKGIKITRVPVVRTALIDNTRYDGAALRAMKGR